MQNPVECKDRVVNIAGSAGYDEKSKFPYEYVADVKDEYDQSISLPDLRTNLDGDLNEVSISYFYA